MSELEISSGLLETLLGAVRRYGKDGVETGAFLLAGAEEPQRLVALALPEQAGVLRRENLFALSGETLGTLFDWAAAHDVLVRAQVHSHKRGAFLSRTDLKGGFNVEGFITSVIPRFADPPISPARWGWWEYDGSRWRARPAPRRFKAQAEVIDFEEGSVRGR